MSGGEKKKKPTKTQGWEEAGSEFYQESYPTDQAEFDAIQRDPKHLATLLPSKQTRAVATTIRIRTNDNRTIRRQTSSRSRRESTTVHRRASTTADVQVSMLPDLSENLSNEQTTWEEIMMIKAMPVPMAQKKEMKAKILNEPNLRLQGYEQFKWKRRKMWRQFQSHLKESYSKLELWKNSLKRIEGNFGTGVVSYFLFLKWLLFLNLMIFVLIFLFISLPTILLYNNSNSNSNCTSIINDPGTFILDLIQGTGFMECTLLYYGYYTNETFIYINNNINSYYNLPLAYICIVIIYFSLSLICIVKSAAKGFKERLVEGEGQFYQYCNLIFGGWDFCIHNEKSAQSKHKALLNEMKGCLETERLIEAKQNRTRNEHIKLILIRFIINLLVVVILILCGFAIYYIFNLCQDQLKLINNNNCLIKTSNDFEQLLYEFLPSISIVCLNILIPFLFKYLITFENYYNHWFIIRLTLIRTVFLRLASLIVLYASLYIKITNSDNESNNNCQIITCWETYVGQQIYKLVLTDFATHLFLTFFINFPRSLLSKHLNNKFIKLIGEQTFDLSKHVLDIVYLQTLCWFGCFFIPLLSLISVLILFIMFYTKKFTCLINSKPSPTIYHASRSNSMFMIVLLVSFVFAILPMAYSISELIPSDSCGPFQGFESVWSLIVESFLQTPIWLQSVVFFLSTAGFAVPVFIVLVLLLYYYTAVTSANRHMVNVLKNQLVLEGHDKQFLLERLSKFIKHQQQENQKRLRQQQQQQQQGGDNVTNLSGN